MAYVHGSAASHRVWLRVEESNIIATCEPIVFETEPFSYVILTVEYRNSAPAAVGLGIHGVERENGGSDNGVESCEIIVGMFMSGLS